ncbi:MAG: threonyl-tRNA synthetase editing domain-containing protein, partial [Nitrososphaerales archaeon]
MRILQLHVDFVEYLPVKKEIDDAEPLLKNEKERIEDTVVILISIERGDDETLIEDFIKETVEYLKKIKCNSVLIYPYAHLSSTLEPPKSAFKLIIQLENALRTSTDSIIVKRAPFGWTKELGIKVKGHPLSENSRLIVKKNPERQTGTLVEIANSKSDTDESEGSFSNALTAEKDLKSNWYVLTVDGALIPYNDYKFKKSEINLENLFKYEILRKRTVEDQPPHVKLMRKLGIADYEPASDSGNMRFYPKGRLL